MTTRTRVDHAATTAPRCSLARQIGNYIIPPLTLIGGVEATSSASWNLSTNSHVPALAALITNSHVPALRWLP